LAKNDRQDAQPLPDGWISAEMENLANVQSGVGFPKALQGKTSGDLPLAKVSDISNATLENSGILSQAANYVSAAEARELRGIIFPSKSILFAKIGEAIRLNRRVMNTVPTLVGQQRDGANPQD
jgi:type I restriction enzyme S subunit